MDLVEVRRAHWPGKRSAPSISEISSLIPGPPDTGPAVTSAPRPCTRPPGTVSPGTLVLGLALQTGNARAVSGKCGGCPTRAWVASKFTVDPERMLEALNLAPESRRSEGAHTFKRQPCAAIVSWLRAGCLAR